MYYAVQRECYLEEGVTQPGLAGLGEGSYDTDCIPGINCPGDTEGPPIRGPITNIIGVQRPSKPQITQPLWPFLPPQKPPVKVTVVNRPVQWVTMPDGAQISQEFYDRMQQEAADRERREREEQELKLRVEEQQREQQEIRKIKKTDEERLEDKGLAFDERMGARLRALKNAIQKKYDNLRRHPEVPLPPDIEAKKREEEQLLEKQYAEARVRVAPSKASKEQLVRAIHGYEVAKIENRVSDPIQKAAAMLRLDKQYNRAIKPFIGKVEKAVKNVAKKVKEVAEDMEKQVKSVLDIGNEEQDENLKIMRRE